MKVGDKVFLVSCFGNPIGLETIDRETAKFFNIGDKKYRKSTRVLFGTIGYCNGYAIYSIAEYSEELNQKYQLLKERIVAPRLSLLHGSKDTTKNKS